MNAALTVAAVLAGGAVGAPLRFLIDLSVTGRAMRLERWRDFPWGLLVVNALGSAIAGSVVMLTAGDLQTFLLVGFCGALTTFSGFAWEVDRLRPIAPRLSWLAVIVIPVACVLAFEAGRLVTSALAP